MKILCTGLTLHPKWGGGEPKIAKSVVKFLSDRHSCKVITFHPFLTSRVRKPSSFIFNDLDPALWVYKKQLKKFMPDIILTFTEPSTSIFQACHSNSIPLILSLHIHWPYSFDSSGVPTPERLHNSSLPLNQKIKSKLARGLLLRQYTRRIERIKLATRVVTASEYMKKTLMKNCGLSSEKIKVIYNGIDFKNFNLPSNHISKENLFLMVGPLTERKGIKHFIQLAKSFEKKKDAKFVATGLFNPKMMKEGVIYPGYVRRSSLIELIKKARAVVLPSLWPEPSSLVILEAMACATPVIAYDQGGNAELIDHGRTGFVIPALDIRALEQKVTLLYEDEQLAIKMGEAGTIKVKSFFNVKRMCNEYETFILNCIELQ